IEVVNVQVEVLNGMLEAGVMAQVVQTVGDCLIRYPPDDPVEDPQACTGSGHSAAFATTGAILPTTSVLCSSA
ncbi:MAG: hypothetical protein QOC63_5730, partial [Mycobacterium sp.]|nr:hypothetical protein [Mycobacterium sp.]